jgi:serine/threonine protein phosphatase 1
MFSRGPLARGQKSAGPRGYRAYVVGDIHGRLDLLEELLSLVEQDVQARPKSKNRIVFLGDLIDRGPHSAQVVERLRLFRPTFGKPIFLMGNHEEVMLRVLGGEARLMDDWLKFGGAECIRSYDLDPASLRSMPPDQAVQTLNGAVPETHVDFIRSFADTVSFGSYLFVHAGIRPGVRLPDQRETDLRWIRHPFLDDPSDHGFTVVHGHTITEHVEIRPNRIGLDTGAYRTGVLTALGIEESDRWFLQTGNRMASP